MRKITIVMDDDGRAQVEILPDPENGRFFTKRDFDNSVRAMKKAYRTSIKEYRKKNRSIKKVKEPENVKHEQNSGEIEDGKEIRREEPRADSSRTKEQAFRGAAEQALKRSGKLRFSKKS